MINQYNPKIFNKFLEYLFIILITLQANSVYVVGIGVINKILYPLIYLLLLVLMIIALCNEIFSDNNYLHNSGYNKILIFIFIVTPIVLIFLLLEYFRYKFSFNKFISMIIFPIILLIYMFYLYEHNRVKALLYEFENVVVILSIMSLIFWIAALLGFKTNMTVPINFGVAHNFSISGYRVVPGYFNIDFITQGKQNFLGLNLIRNTGIFAEAPIYSSVLIIALLIELFLKKKTNDKKLLNYKTIILVITLLSTTSTNGLIVMIPSFIFADLFTYHKDKNLFVQIFCCFLFILIILYVQSTIFNKLGDTATNSSSSLRSNDFIVAVKAWSNHLILGNGIGNYMSVIPYMPSWRVLNGNGSIAMSTGFMSVLAYGGILLELYYMIPLIYSMKISKNIFFFSLFVFLLFIIEDISGYYIFIIILSYLWITILLGNSNTEQINFN